jgi:hypothetical protein
MSSVRRRRPCRPFWCIYSIFTEIAMPDLSLRLIATIILSWPGALSALAQTPDRPEPAERSNAPSRHLPLDAMRHHQPRAQDVEQREAEQSGPGAAEAQRRQRSEVDQLYDDVMRRSAPAERQ